MHSIRTKFSAERDSYQQAMPFPHIAIQGVFDAATLRKLSNGFPARERMGDGFTGVIEVGKFTEADWGKFGPLTQEMDAKFPEFTCSDQIFQAHFFGHKRYTNFMNVVGDRNIPL